MTIQDRTYTRANLKDVRDMITWLEARGYRFAKADEVLADAAFKDAPRFIGDAEAGRSTPKPTTINKTGLTSEPMNVRAGSAIGEST